MTKSLMILVGMKKISTYLGMSPKRVLRFKDKEPTLPIRKFKRGWLGHKDQLDEWFSSYVSKQWHYVLRKEHERRNINSVNKHSRR